MKRLFAILILLAASVGWAADPAMKFSLDADGYGRISPDLAKGTAYTLYPYSASDGSLILGMAYIDAGRPRLAFYTLGLRFDGKPFPTPIPPGPVPPPTPPIPPDPPPVPPTPTVQKIIAVVVEETSNSTPAFAQVRSSKAIRDWMKAGGHVVFFLDQDAKDETGATPKSFKPWIDLAKADKLPVLLIQSAATKNLLEKLPCPTNEADFMAAVQKWGGKQ